MNYLAYIGTYILMYMYVLMYVYIFILVLFTKYIFQNTSTKYILNYIIDLID